MYLALGHHTVHDTVAAWTVKSWQLGAVERHHSGARSSGDVEATVRLVGLSVAGNTHFR